MKKVKLNALDRIISYFSPGASVKRIQSKIRQDILTDHFKRSYEGAAIGRRTQNWYTANSDANAQIDSATELLRSRSRDLIRNNPWAARGIQVLESNIVGRGIMVEFDGMKRQARRLNELWKDWSENPELCDWNGLNDFYGIQRTVIRSVVESGEVLVRLHFTPDILVPLQLEVLEPDFINRFKLSTTSTSKIISGIEVDDKGRRVAYHLYKEHPGSKSIFNFSNITESVRLESRFILHVYRLDRPGQLRGVPWLSPVMIKLREFDEYEDAQIVKQKISACLTGFIIDPDGPAGLTDGEIEIAEKYEPATINILGPGQDFKESNPPKVDGYKEFTTAVLHSIASGLGISYESLTGDLSETNFSSAKMGRQEMERNITSWREQMFYPQFLTPVIKNWLMAVDLSGTPAIGSGWKYTAPRKEMIQPDKEVPAMVDAIRAGLMSLREGIRQLGYDPDKVLAEVSETNQLIDSLGLVLDSDPRKTTKNANQYEQSNNSSEQQ